VLTLSRHEPIGNQIGRIGREIADGSLRMSPEDEERYAVTGLAQRARNIGESQRNGKP
jgi:hypothetical protein